jgi:hypothetical protein
MNEGTKLKKESEYFLRGNSLWIWERDRPDRRSRRLAGCIQRECFRPEAENGGRDARAPEGILSAS